MSSCLSIHIDIRFFNIFRAECQAKHSARHLLYMCICLPNAEMRYLFTFNYFHFFVCFLNVELNVEQAKHSVRHYFLKFFFSNVKLTEQSADRFNSLIGLYVIKTYMPIP